MNIYLVIGLAYTVYFMLVLLLGRILGLSGNDLWILRGGMALIGLVAAIAYLWYSLSSAKRQVSSGKKSKRETRAGSGPAPDSEINLIIREAESRLAMSELGRKAKLSKLPVILLLGKEGSTKTTSMLHSGLEPELLAGQVYRDTAVVPTRGANIWYARRAVFVEAGGKLLAEPSQWKKLIRKLRPRFFSSIFGGGQQAPRAAVVCLSCEEFLKPGATEALSATARELRARLEEAAHDIGIRLPVYVLLTKADRVAFFAEYVRNLSSEETGQVVGVTLPVDPDQTAGVYAERQSRRLSEAFNNLCHSLCDKRPDLLVREHDPDKLAGAYEFPREIRKIRPTLVQLLVDICRPSQLRAGPYLRGFYFTGVRAVITEEAPAQAPAPRAAEQGYGSVDAATMVFETEQARQAQAAAAPSAPVARKVPQWVFLSHLFSDVLLGDWAAIECSASSTKASRARRILLATAAMLCVIWIIGLIVSFIGNRALENEALEAARGISAAEAAGGEIASLDALTRLETLRQSLETLTSYELDGPPYRLRWGVYAGDDLYPSVRRAYYRRFHQLLFATAQAGLVDTLQRLPAKPSPVDEYGPIYDALKAYLITTTHPDKSTREFLAPVLAAHWKKNREVDAERMNLAQMQFDFYAGDLPSSNPFTSDQDSLAVQRGRRYLSQFAGLERVYQYMLAEASRENPSVNFNSRFPGSAAVVVNSREVSGAFTKGGWAFMQDAMKNASRFFGGEQWVLGEGAVASIDPAELERQLSTRYLGDFITSWREYLRATSVVRYRSLPDAAKKLNSLSGNQSPLLAALWLASQNTSVESEQIKQAFQPVQLVAPPENEGRFIGESNSGYMNALVGLQASVEQAAGTPASGRDPIVAQINAQATNAKVVTRQVAQGFRADPELKIDSTVQNLMETPILYAEALVRALGPAELNAKGNGLCAQCRALLAKYPFQENAKTEATLAEVAAIFQPGTGALWTFYEQDLRELLVKQGTLYVAQPRSKIRLNPDFVNFFNRAASFSEVVYPGGSAQPRLAYKLTAQPPEGMRSLSLTVENTTLTSSRGRMVSAEFVWPGSGNQRVTLTGRFGGGSELTFVAYEGLWAVFRFFGEADRWQTSGSAHRLEWMLRQGRAGRPLTLPDGRPLTVRFDLETAAPVFQKGFLAGLNCVSRVAR